MNAREWLRRNGYSSIAKEITDIEAEWKTAGKKTRRNWWQILAGDSNGHQREVAGRIFPIIHAIRKRQGLGVSSQALSRNKREKAPRVKISGRWPKRVI